jgi:hypothetical protein
MSRLKVTALLALLALALPGPAALAQERAHRTDPASLSNAGGADSSNDVQTCAPNASESHVQKNCETPETTTVRLEKTLKLAIELPAIPSAECAATTRTEYQQRNTAARVSGAISISDCTAAAGAFTVAVRVKDENGQSKVLDFDETWQRGDDRDVSFAADYPIGDNVELVSVRVRGLTCTCADAPKIE